MENFLILSLLSYSIFWALNFSELFVSLRKVLKVEEASTCYQKLYQCSYCVSFHLSWIFMLIQGIGLMSFIWAFVPAILSYFIYLIEKLIEKHIAF